MSFSCVWRVIAACFGRVRSAGSSGFLEWSKLKECGINPGQMCVQWRRERGTNVWNLALL